VNVFTRKGERMSRSRSHFGGHPRTPGFVALIGALVLTAACGGSNQQRDAVAKRQALLAAAAGQLAAGAQAAGPGAAAATDQNAGDPSAAGSAGSEAAGGSAPAAVAAGSGPSSSGTAGVATGPSGRSGSASTGAASAGAAKSSAAAPGAAAGPGTGVPGAPAPGAPDAGGAGGATDVGVTASSIKLGHIGIYSGPVGSFGQHLSFACRAGLQSVNDAGGVNGRKYDVLVRDDGWDATKGSNAVRDLVERQKVFGLACSQSVPTNDAITPYLDQQKTPNIGSDGWGEAQYAGQWSYPTGASGVNQAQNLALYQAQKQGAKAVGVLYWNNTTGKAYLDAYKKIIEQNGGKVAVAQAANFDDPGTSTFIAQARAANVDTITTMVDPGIFARMVREAAAQGFKPKNGFSGGAALYFQATPGLTGPAGDGTISAIDWVPDDLSGPASSSAGYRDYKAVTEKYFPQIDHSNWTKTAFVGARVLTDALKRLGLNVTRQRLKDDLDRVADFDTGLGARIGFQPGQPHRSHKTTYLAQLRNENGKLVWKYLAGPLTR
jgi:ABC-type branched-subunit amino acid transport system substrate-binding protein